MTIFSGTLHHKIVTFFGDSNILYQGWNGWKSRYQVRWKRQVEVLNVYAQHSYKTGPILNVQVVCQNYATPKIDFISPAYVPFSVPFKISYLIL